MSYQQQDDLWNLFCEVASAFLFISPTLVAGLVSGWVALKRQTAAAAFASGFLITLIGSVVLCFLGGLFVIVDQWAALEIVVVTIVQFFTALGTGAVFGAIWAFLLKRRSRFTAPGQLSPRPAFYLLVTALVLVVPAAVLGYMARDGRLEKVPAIPPGMIARPEARALSDWLADLQNPDVAARRGAVLALGQLSLGRCRLLTLPALLEALKDPDPGVRDLAEHWLLARFNCASPGSAVSREEFPTVRMALKSPDERVRRTAAEILLDTSLRFSSELFPDLVAALKDDDPFVRRTAATALGHSDEKAIPALKEALKDSDESVRKSVARALEEVEARFPTANPERRAKAP
jgi:hypothetical protein